MWHEARKQEKKLRGMMVDWKKRAERRRQYYENLVATFLLLLETIECHQSRSSILSII